MPSRDKPDAIALLKEDHRKVEKMFDQYEKTKDEMSAEEKAELVGRREAQAECPRQGPPGCLEHEELARDTRLQLSTCQTQEDVRADRLVRKNRQPLASHASAVGAEGADGLDPLL